MSNEVLVKQGNKAEWARDNAPIDPKRLPEGYPYKGQSEVEVLPETSLSLTETGQDGIFLWTGGSSFDIEVGKQYKVIWDGSEYLVEGKEDGNESQRIQYIGNAALSGGGGEDTGEPFVITVMEGYGQYFGTSAGEHTVSIFGYAETTHPISSDFLPLATPTTAGAMKQAAAVANVTAAPTAEEFNALLKSLRDAGILATS